MKRLPASYRDPSGYIFLDGDHLRRQINPVFFEEYSAAVNAGIYEKLFAKGWLIPHREVSRDADKIILEPEHIPFINYPYEWSFTQYKHAAQLTLQLQMFLLEHDFSLKDASARLKSGCRFLIRLLKLSRSSLPKPIDGEGCIRSITIGKMSAAFFSRISEHLIIEFPDREDSWVQFILDSKRDARHLFDDYNLSAFAKAYSEYYHIDKQQKIEGTHRTLFLMRRK